VNKFYFNPKKKKKDSGVENEKRRLNNEAIKKSVSRRGNKKHNGQTP
jgi:hypothetical protein